MRHEWNGAIVRRRTLLLAAMREHIPDVAHIVALNESRHMLAFSADAAGFVSYASRPDHIWSDKKRLRTTLGRYLSRRLHIAVDNGMRLAVDKVSASGPLSESALWVRSDVRNCYEEYSPKGNCMAENPNDCLGWYEDNGVKVLWSDDPRGRALLWTLDTGDLFLDRVYPNDGPVVSRMREWARARGVLNREHEALPSYGFADYCDKLSFTPRVMDDRMPYQDTLAMLNDGRNGRTLSNGYEDSYTIKLEGISGYLDDNDRIVCADCNARLDEDSEYSCPNGDSYCESCWSSTWTYCSECGETTSHDDARVCDDNHQVYCDSCASGVAETCESCCEVRLVDYIVYTEEGETYCDDCAETETRVCDECGERHTAHSAFYDDSETCYDCSGRPSGWSTFHVPIYSYNPTRTDRWIKEKSQWRFIPVIGPHSSKIYPVAFDVRYSWEGFNPGECTAEQSPYNPLATTPALIGV